MNSIKTTMTYIYILIVIFAINFYLANLSLSIKINKIIKLLEKTIIENRHNSK